MDIPAKIQYMRKHRPIPLTDGSSWKIGQTNHSPLVELDSNGNPTVDTSGKTYRWSDHLFKAFKDRWLVFESEYDWELDITDYFLLSSNTPDGAVSWLGTREIWLPAVMQSMPEDHAG